MQILEILLAHALKYMFVTFILLLGGFERHQAVAMAVVGAYLEFMMKVWAGNQSIALQSEIKNLQEKFDREKK